VEIQKKTKEIRRFQRKMSYTSKYNVDERQIARKIANYKSYQALLRKKYYLTEMKINVCISKLGGKYGNGKEKIKKWQK